MAVYPGTFIPTEAVGSAAYDTLIDTNLTPRLLSFRQVHIWDEPAALKPDDNATWHVTFGNWLDGEDFVFRKGGSPLPPASVTDIDYVHGTFKVGAVDMGADNRRRDFVEVNYVFDYFPAQVLKNLLDTALQVVNTGAFGPPTTYTIETMPSYWCGVVTDIAFAMAMERMMLDYQLWRYRLVFALNPNDVYEGGGDVMSTIESLKQNAEERAAQTMENEKFKSGNYLSPPTVFYFDSIRGAGTSGPHGVPFLGGRLNGWRPNRWW